MKTANYPSSNSEPSLLILRLLDTSRIWRSCLILIVAPEVSFPNQNESARSDTRSSRYLQNTETCAAGPKEALTTSYLPSIFLHLSAPSSADPSGRFFIKDPSPTISHRRFFANHLSQITLRRQCLGNHPSNHVLCKGSFSNYLS